MESSLEGKIITAGAVNGAVNEKERQMKKKRNSQLEVLIVDDVSLNSEKETLLDPLSIKGGEGGRSFLHHGLSHC